MNRDKIHQNIDKTLDGLETASTVVSNKLSILSNKLRSIVRPIGLNIQAFKLTQKMGRASLYVEILDKISNDRELSELEQMVFDQMNRKIESRYYSFRDKRDIKASIQND